jgi:hypothetical protein
VGLRAGLERCTKFLPHRDFNHRLSSPYLVTIPTELPGPLPIAVSLAQVTLLKVSYGECNSMNIS